MEYFRNTNMPGYIGCKYFREGTSASKIGPQEKLLHPPFWEPLVFVGGDFRVI